MRNWKAVIAGGLAGLLLVAGVTASASTNTASRFARATADCPAVNGLPEYQDYGSGCLDPLWPTRAHGQYGNLAGPDVMIVGDSITTLCKTSLTVRLANAGLTYGVSYWSSRPTTPAVDWVLSLSVKPHQVLMLTGTNDIFNPPVMTAQINRLRSDPSMALTDIRWIDVQAARPATAEADQRNAMWVNRQIWSSGVPVINWASQFYTQPNRIAAYLDSGGVHPIATPAPGVGCEFWAQNIYNQIIGPALAAKKKAGVVKPK